MSMSIDELNSIYGVYGVNGLTQSSTTQQVSTAGADKKSTDGDSYISTIAGTDASAPIPSENYNDLARMIKTASKAGSTANTTDYADVEESATAEETEVGAAGGAGGSGGSDSDEDTETEIVTINGQTYLQTTTTDSNGNTTVTRVPIGVANSGEDGKTGSTGSVSAAQLLSGL